MLSRDTKWRQGGILTFESSLALGLFTKDEVDFCAVVISHDCDIPNAKEEYVEIIVGKKTTTVNPVYARSRNVRCLHLSYIHSNNATLVCVELQHSGHKKICKKLFSDQARLEMELNLIADEKLSLKQWLAARYARPAFPNEFEKRLQNSKKLHPKLEKLLKPINTYLIGIFFDLGEERGEELADKNPYYLKISLVYNSAEGIISRTKIEECCSNITLLFYETFGTPDVADELVLESCQAVADTFFSVADIRKTDQWWRYDYLSLAESPASPFLPIG